MSVTIEKKSDNHFVAEYERLERDYVNAGAWFSPVRKAAIAHFAEQGVPTTKHEDWRYTNVAMLARTPFDPAAPRKMAEADLRGFLFGEPAATRLVFVNGFFDAELSILSGLPKGVTLATLAALLRDEPGTLRPHLGRYAGFERSPFTALNTALFRDGAFLHVPRGVVLEQPIHVLYVSGGGERPAAAHPRTLVVAEEASQATLIESFVSVEGGGHFTNAVAEVIAGEGAVVDHYRLGREADDVVHISTLRVHQARNSSVSSHSLTLGGALVRNEVQAVLDGEGADLDLNGLYLGRGDRHIDNHLRVEHAQPHCSSREYYKGILEDRSHGVFTGRIVVLKDAQKTDAKQTNMNLLLSGDAQIDTKPQLEIFADDVKCTHGATIGQIEESELFYLRSRGIPQAEARKLLIYAFASESLSRIRVEPIRRAMESQLFADAARDRGQKEANGR